MLERTQATLKRRLPRRLVGFLDRLIHRQPFAYVLSKLKFRGILKTILKSRGYVVQAGPFVGMEYRHTNYVVDGRTLPQLLGSYEEELHETLEALFHRGYSRVIDVGCADGYYAVGCAMRLPLAEVHAFDVDRRAQGQCRELAEINGVSQRVHVAGECTVELLTELASTGTLLIVDCDGCEKELLNPHLAPSLADCDLLVETHDFLVPRTSETILERFRDTHDLFAIGSASRDPSTYPILSSFGALRQQRALGEFRGVEQQWMVMVRKDKLTH